MKKILRPFLRLFHLVIIVAICHPLKAQNSIDLGEPAYSTLKWDHISSFDNGDLGSASIGLTKDGRVYTWGGNLAYTSNAGVSASGRPMAQLVPYFVNFPASETPKKVRVAHSFNLGASYAGGRLPAFFCLTASGKMYVWGINSGIAGSNLATFPVVTTTPAADDTTKAKRLPILMTNIGESTFVDMDFSKTGEYGIVIGESGKAYHIGNNGLSAAYVNTFLALPNPAGVSGSFKYTNVWLSDFYNNAPLIYLKGNDGNIYFTGIMTANATSGVPSIYYRNSTAPTFDTAEFQGNVRSITPRQVPFPAGEDIIEINVRSKEMFDNTYAISASGKAYVAGAWRFGFRTDDYRVYVVAPLKATPPAEQLDIFAISPGNLDTVYTLKQFSEIAMPPGATKVLSILGASDNRLQNEGTLIVGDNNKVYWSGSANDNVIRNDIFISNFLEIGNTTTVLPDECREISRVRSNSYYSWLYEALSYRGAAKIFRSRTERQLGIISASGRGYFVGLLAPNTGPGKIMSEGGLSRYTVPYPVPIANELLLGCNLSTGTGSGESEVSAGVGAIDCSKTKLSPAPLAGVPSQLTLSVTVNVTTAGSFSPLSVSGSGMSLGNGITSVATTTTGVQTFSVPINYDGSTLTNAFQFTIGQAGGCTADLTTKPNKEITNVWSLTNCSAITPGVLSK